MATTPGFLVQLKGCMIPKTKESQLR